MKKNTYSVFVGRFQPFHNAHLRIVEESLKQTEHIILVVGSYRVPFSVRNP